MGYIHKPLLKPNGFPPGLDEIRGSQLFHGLQGVVGRHAIQLTVAPLQTFHAPPVRWGYPLVNIQKMVV